MAVCLYDPVARVGGLNHSLLPHAREQAPSARFGDVAVPWLIRDLTGAGADARRLYAKVFGGACVLEAYRHLPGHVGRQNTHIALEMLADAGIPVLTVDVGGNRARRVFFEPHTGDTVVRTL